MMRSTHFKSVFQLCTFFSIGLALQTISANADPLAGGPNGFKQAVGDTWLARSVSAMTMQSMSSSSTLASVGKRPVGAFGTSYQLSQGDLFVWQSKSPHNEADSEAVVIMTHGVDRNANDYFTTINDAFKSANSAGLANAPTNTLRVAPLFFDVNADSHALNDSTLAWGKNNAWCLGEGSVNPANSGLSTLSVFDELIAKFSDKTAYPKVKSITLAGHGCGGIITQRYAALTKTAPSGISLRYVVGNPSSMLYYTTDRPSASFKPSSCPNFNEYFFGLSNFYIPYDAPESPSAAFKSYASRDVRYLVSLDDNGGGDQSCEAKAAGGTARKSRTLAYWKYIHLLAGYAASSYSSFPGDFPNIGSNNAAFKGASVNHQLYQLSGVGHNAQSVIQSEQGKRAIFG